MPRCPTCETQYDDAAPGCPRCDGEMVRCSRCEAEYSGSDACPACGTLGAPASCETHPDREAVGQCVLCGRSVCSVCRSDDRHAVVCGDHPGVSVIEGWAQVYSTNSDFEAQLLRENLKAEGIDAQIFSQRDHMLSVELGDLSLVRLLVPVWEYGSARALIRQHMDPEGEVVFACPTCGEAYDPGAAECTACGAPLA